MAEIILVRHGETEWSASGWHTSVTDLPLTARGEEQARALAPALATGGFAAVLVSPRQRALRTAELSGLAVTGVDPDLAEWDYGRYEGLTSARIMTERPDWSLWTDGAPDGESPQQVGARTDSVLARVRSLLGGGDVVIVGHAHALRVLAARWVGLPASGGGLLRLDTATISALGTEHARHVINRWNCSPGGFRSPGAVTS